MYVLLLQPLVAQNYLGIIRQFIYQQWKYLPALQRTVSAPCFDHNRIIKRKEIKVTVRHSHYFLCQGSLNKYIFKSIYKTFFQIVFSQKKKNQKELFVDTNNHCYKQCQNNLLFVCLKSNTYLEIPIVRAFKFWQSFITTAFSQLLTRVVLCS